MAVTAASTQIPLSLKVEVAAVEITLRAVAGAWLVLLRTQQSIQVVMVATSGVL